MHNPIPIKVAMVTRDITGEQLAVLSGLSRPTISKIVHGKSVLPTKLKAAADALGVSMEELFTPPQQLEEREVAMK